jgi:hypothetical protein
MDTIRIPLGRSGHADAWATIDIEDYERVALFRWYRNKEGYPFIAYARGTDRKTTYLHAYVLGRENGTDDGLQVDHIDRDPLNARKANLRLVTKEENMANTSTNDRMRKQAQDFTEIARSLRSMGVAIRIISEALGIPESSVAKLCEGIDYQERRRTKPWTREEIIERFDAFKREHGRLPVRRDLGKHGLPWRDTFLKYFDSLDAAYACMSP